MNFWLADPVHRPALEAPWLEHFPDDASRPARHTQISNGAAMRLGRLPAYVTD